jgi:hypothetical protein
MTTTAPAPTSVDATALVLEQAWRVHTVQAEMTRSVDSKASIALAIETAVLAGVLSLASTGGLLADLAGPARLVLWAGVAILVAGVGAVGAVVRPRLRARAAGGDDIVFFGHLRHWHEDDLVDELAGPELTTVVSRQAIAIAQIAWTKHRLLQHSLTATAAGAALVASASLLAHLPG